MGHSIKRGDTPTLKWNLSRDLTGVTAARVLIAKTPGGALAVSRDGAIESPAADGIVSLAIQAGDYGTGKLEPGTFYVEIQTTDGAGAILTHPDNGYDALTVVPDLGP